MQISNTIALVTGANRGLGLAFSRELVRRGAAKVYGAARQPGQVTEPGVTPVGLDITDQAQVAAAAGFIDTDMAALASGPKDSPEDVVRQALDAVESGQVEVLADERTRTVKASLSRDHELIYPAIQEFWDSAIS